MKTFLPFIQIGISVILIILVLLQQRGTALGSSFGQESGFYGTLRGAEKKIFILTCVFGAIFIILTLLSPIF
ncbi:MAG: preprotein translocase subunit SecG [Candidatus Pacebacteria bacterium]|nr:preprotein translocase subunit SecG [Candidatus Paceibacterota bacterium]